MTLQSHCSGRSNSIAERLVFVLSLFLVAILADRHRIKRVRASKPLCAVSESCMPNDTQGNGHTERGRGEERDVAGGASLSSRRRRLLGECARSCSYAATAPTTTTTCFGRPDRTGQQTNCRVPHTIVASNRMIGQYDSRYRCLLIGPVFAVIQWRAPPSPISKNLACFVYSFKKIIDNNNILYSRLHNCTENRQNYCCQSALRRAQNGLLILPVYLHLKAPSGVWILTNL